MYYEKDTVLIFTGMEKGSYVRSAVVVPTPSVILSLILSLPSIPSPLGPRKPARARDKRFWHPPVNPFDGKMDDLSIGSNSKNIIALQQKESLIQQEPSHVFQPATIGSLPDNVLIEIFDFYQVVINKNMVDNEDPWDWERLVHLFCTEKSPVRKLLDVWPPFPLVIRLNYDHWYPAWEGPKECIDSMDNLVAALEHRDRVHGIQVDTADAPDHLCEQIFTAMGGPFPALRSLSFRSSSENTLLPDTLLNGSAPCLRDLTLWEISFPSLPRLLSSTSDLTALSLYNIPWLGCISPETMATSLSALPKLEYLMINFHYMIPHRPHPERRNRAPTRFVLPALRRLMFEGVSDYLEVLAARFDAPLLDDLLIVLFDQVVFDIPQTARLCSCYLDSFNAYSLTLTFQFRDTTIITFPSDTTHHSVFSPSKSVYLYIMSKDKGRQVLYVAHICGQIPPLRSGVKSLIIKCDSHTEIMIDDPTQWLQLFHSFPSLQSLQISVALEQSIASALERPTEESLAAADSEVFPSLHSLSIVGNQSGETVQPPIQSFVAARQHSGRPVAVSRVRILNEERIFHTLTTAARPVPSGPHKSCAPQYSLRPRLPHMPRLDDFILSMRHFREKLRTVGRASTSLASDLTLVANPDSDRADPDKGRFRKGIFLESASIRTRDLHAGLVKNASRSAGEALEQVEKSGQSPKLLAK
ncbi:hypothetical protein BGW80DRAFT_1255188 [Lactifluus volemus]|nr:hypothetical protein BGW80DRAFT_1255188 [Lactifluus volemus]